MFAKENKKIQALKKSIACFIQTEVNSNIRNILEISNSVCKGKSFFYDKHL